MTETRLLSATKEQNIHQGTHFAKNCALFAAKQDQVQSVVCTSDTHDIQNSRHLQIVNLTV